MRRGVLLVVVVALAGLAAFRLQAETRYRLLATRTVGELLSEPQEPRASMVLVFQPEDCLGDGALVSEWNRAFHSAKLPVHGLVVGEGRLSERQIRLFRELRLEMPIQRMSGRRAAVVAERLGYASTPFAVLLDSEGRVAAAFPAAGPIPPSLLDRIATGT